MLHEERLAHQYCQEAARRLLIEKATRSVYYLAQDREQGAQLRGCQNNLVGLLHTGGVHVDVEGLLEVNKAIAEAYVLANRRVIRLVRRGGFSDGCVIPSPLVAFDGGFRR